MHEAVNVNVSPAALDAPDAVGWPRQWTIELVATRSMAPGEPVYIIPMTATLGLDDDDSPVSSFLADAVTLPAPIDRWASETEDTNDEGESEGGSEGGWVSDSDGNSAEHTVATNAGGHDNMSVDTSERMAEAGEVAPAAVGPPGRGATRRRGRRGADNTETSADDAVVEDDDAPRRYDDSDSDEEADEDEKWDPTPFDPEGGVVERDLQWIRAALLCMHGWTAHPDTVEAEWGVIAALPDLAELRSTLTWTHDELAALDGLSVAHAVVADRADVAAEYADIARELVAANPELFPGIDSDNSDDSGGGGGAMDGGARLGGGGGGEAIYRQCVGFLAAAGCASPRGDLVVAPSLALIPRAMDGNLVIDLDDDGDGIVLVTSASVSSGEKLQLEVDSTSYSDAFRRFGLPPPIPDLAGFPEDAVLLSLTELSHAARTTVDLLDDKNEALAERKNKLLTDRGFLCHRDREVFPVSRGDVAVFACPTADRDHLRCSVPRVVVAGFVLGLSPSELDAFENQNYVALLTDDEDDAVSVASDSDCGDSDHECPELVPADMLAAAISELLPSTTRDAGASGGPRLPWAAQAKGWSVVAAAIAIRYQSTAPGRGPERSSAWRDWVASSAKGARRAEHVLCAELLEQIEGVH